MPDAITIPVSFFDVEVEYKSPSFRILIERMTVAQPVFDALSAWQPNLNDLEFINSGRNSEQGLTLRLPSRKVTFFVGAASCRFIKENASWQEASETLAIFDQAMSGLHCAVGVEANVHRAALEMHLQLRRTPYVDVLKKLIPGPLASLDDGPMVTAAAVAKWRTWRVTIDASSAVANAIYVRLERELPGEVTSAAIASALREDQRKLFAFLDVSEEVE